MAAGSGAAQYQRSSEPVPPPRDQHPTIAVIQPGEIVLSWSTASYVTALYKNGILTMHEIRELYTGATIAHNVMLPG